MICDCLKTSFIEPDMKALSQAHWSGIQATGEGVFRFALRTHEQKSDADKEYERSDLKVFLLIYGV